MSKKINARTATVNVLLRLIKQQGSLASELSSELARLDKQEQGLAQEFCYGICRWYFLLENTLKQWVKKPLKAKDADIKLLLLLGIYQLQFTRVAPHAAINETVNAAIFFHKPWAKKLINGVLRSFQRQQSAEASASHTSQVNAEEHQQAHPQWLQEIIKSAWQSRAADIFAANNQYPPFTLRTNIQEITREDYQQRLNQAALEHTTAHYSPVGITLNKAIPVTRLPGFEEGVVSVQDEAAQLAADLLQLKPQQRVLDACCAPGGKTCHIAETQTGLQQLVALDVDQRRLVRVRENIERLGVSAQVICGDASHPEAWWDGNAFDRILLDAPCSATGVIRRHPDIKLLRQPSAINKLVQLQQQLLNALWPLLADGGILLYATCSVLPQENTEIIEQFVRSQESAVHDPIVANWGISQPYGRQLLPQIKGHDGFYYARLIKATRNNDYH